MACIKILILSFVCKHLCNTYAAAWAMRASPSGIIRVMPIFVVVVCKSTTKSVVSGDSTNLGPNSFSISRARRDSTVKGRPSSPTINLACVNSRFKSVSINLRLARCASGFPTSVDIFKDGYCFPTNSGLASNSLMHQTPVYSFPCVPPTTTIDSILFTLTLLLGGATFHETAVGKANTRGRYSSRQVLIILAYSFELVIVVLSALGSRLVVGVSSFLAW
mmetsp:Transcript_26222/g.47584  ORF Transcript_26222/g.47584 Transcript_26222/m.47584 type:complete len:220 (-) Transcript_26222:19-678(-)